MHNSFCLAFVATQNNCLNRCQCLLKIFDLGQLSHSGCALLGFCFGGVFSLIFKVERLC
jgi:hypothetical protein